MPRRRCCTPSGARRRPSRSTGRSAISGSLTPPRNTSRPMWWATRTCRPMAAGPTIPTMARSGRRTRCPPTGSRTVPARGPTRSPMAGPGSTNSRGASRPITTAAGPTATIAGCGCRRNAASVPCMRPRWSPSWAARNSPSRSAIPAPSPWAGSRWDRARPMSRLTPTTGRTTSASTRTPAWSARYWMTGGIVPNAMKRSGPTNKTSA